MGYNEGQQFEENVGFFAIVVGTNKNKHVICRADETSVNAIKASGWPNSGGVLAGKASDR